MDIALTDPRLEELAARLEKDTSALILAAQEVTIEEFVGAFDAYDVEIIETQLNEHDVKAISEAVKAASARNASLKARSPRIAPRSWELAGEALKP